MKLRERLETAGITQMENITVKCGGKILYDGTILSLLENKSPLLEKKILEDFIFHDGKGIEIDVDL